MSMSPNHEVRRRYRETRRAQYLRLAEIVEGAIMFGNKHAVIIPACDYPLLQELLAANEHKLSEEDLRTTRLEIISMFEEQFVQRVGVLPSTYLERFDREKEEPN